MFSVTRPNQAPKNPERLDRLAELDEAFHEDPVALVAASRRNDVAGAAATLGTVSHPGNGAAVGLRIAIPGLA